MYWWFIIENMISWKTLPEIINNLVEYSTIFEMKLYRNHLGRVDDFTSGVNPNLNRFRVLLMLTILNITRLTKNNVKYDWIFNLTFENQQATWSCFTLSTVKLNQNRNRGLQVSGRKNKSYSNSPTKSARPRFPVSNAASKHKWPRFAFPECPGGRMITRLTLPSPPSPSLSSESENN